MADSVHSTNALLRIFRGHAAAVIEEVGLPPDQGREASQLLDRLMAVLDRRVSPDETARIDPVAKKDALVGQGFATPAQLNGSEHSPKPAAKGADSAHAVQRDKPLDKTSGIEITDHASYEADQQRSVVVGDRIIVEGEINFTLRTMGSAIDAGELSYSDLPPDFVNRLQVRQAKKESDRQRELPKSSPRWSFPTKIRVSTSTIVTRGMLETLRGPTEMAYLQVVEARAAGRPDPQIPTSVLKHFKQVDGAIAVEGQPKKTILPAPEMTPVASVAAADVPAAKHPDSPSGNPGQSTNGAREAPASEADTLGHRIFFVVGNRRVSEGDIDYTLRTQGSAIDAGQLRYRDLDRKFMVRLITRQSNAELDAQQNQKRAGWRFPENIRVTSGNVVSREMLTSLRGPKDNFFLQVANARAAGNPDPALPGHLSKFFPIATDAERAADQARLGAVGETQGSVADKATVVAVVADKASSRSNQGGGKQTAGHSNGVDRGPAAAKAEGLAAQIAPAPDLQGLGAHKVLQGSSAYAPAAPPAPAASATSTLASTPPSAPIPPEPAKQTQGNSDGRARPEPSFVRATYDMPAPSRRVAPPPPTPQTDHRPPLPMATPTWSSRTDGTSSRSYRSIFDRTPVPVRPPPSRPASADNGITSFADRRRATPELAVTDYLRTEPHYRTILDERGSIALAVLARDADLQTEWQRNRININNFASANHRHPKARIMHDLVTAMSSDIDRLLLDRVDSANRVLAHEALFKVSKGAVPTLTPPGGTSAPA